MNGRRLVLWSLLLLAGWLALFGDRTPHDAPSGEVVQAALPRAGSGAGVAARAPAATRPVGSGVAASKGSASPEVAALIARDQLIATAIDDRVSRDLFPSLSWLPPPPKPEKPAKPPPPMAPPIPFVYLGKKLESGQWEVYLSRGEEVFIAREGVTLAGIYRVQGINPSTLTLVYLPLKQSQTIFIGGAQ